MNGEGREATSIPYLLTDPKAMPHLVRYINGTRRPPSTIYRLYLSSYAARLIPHANRHSRTRNRPPT
ncbi:hypothetical protein M405DRAFT_821914 [Rhizopogon salebrosus TDB-379]|nr:hypothetical protein M405DRAFT_821914 [Rhizopogon salebrosus TDB-379]